MIVEATAEEYKTALRIAISNSLRAPWVYPRMPEPNPIWDRLRDGGMTHEELLRKCNCHIMRVFEFDGIIYGLGRANEFANRTRLRTTG